MKIYTRKGDTGTTQLIGGTRVPKHHLRIDTYGTVDELNAWIGMVSVFVQEESIKNLLKEIQDRLFTLGSNLAADPENSKMILPDISETDVVSIENEIDRMNESLPELKSFVLPGGSEGNAAAHVARTVCRRAERLTSLLNNTEPVDPLILKYLNRLSDYLFVLARWLTLKNGSNEIIWQPRKL